MCSTVTHLADVIRAPPSECHLRIVRYLLQQNTLRRDDGIWIADHAYLVRTAKVLLVLVITLTTFRQRRRTWQITISEVRHHAHGSTIVSAIQTVEAFTPQELSSDLVRQVIHTTRGKDV